MLLLLATAQHLHSHSHTTKYQEFLSLLECIVLQTILKFGNKQTFQLADFRSMIIISSVLLSSSYSGTKLHCKFYSIPES